MKVITDNQIFLYQKFGGISRLFKDYLDTGVINSTVFTPFSVDYFSKENLFKSRLLNKIKNNGVSFSSSYQRDILCNLDCDLFHPSYYDDYFLDYLKVPYVLTVHDMIHELIPEQFGMDGTILKKQKLIQSATRVMAVSQTTKGDIVRLLGVDSDKIEVIPLYTKYADLNTENIDSFFEKDSYILYTGNRGGYKNFTRFFRAVIPILNKYDHLKIVCTGSNFTALEFDFMKSFEVYDRFVNVFCESDEEMKCLYENALCFVFPSLYEGFGFPLLEAFASNCPVVCSNGGSLIEVAGDGALYFNPKDIEDMTEKLFFLIENFNHRILLKSNGLMRLNDFSLEKTIELTRQFYDRAL